MHYKERSRKLKEICTLDAKEERQCRNDKDNKGKDKVKHGPKFIVSNGISVAVGDAQIAVDVNDVRFKILYKETKDPVY